MKLEAPRQIRPTYNTEYFAAGYINFYVVNKVVIMPEFGAKGDENAKLIVEKLFPKREVVQLNVDVLALGGGGIHCLTQQEPQAAA